LPWENKLLDELSSLYTIEETLPYSSCSSAAVNYSPRFPTQNEHSEYNFFKIRATSTDWLCGWIRHVWLVESGKNRWIWLDEPTLNFGLTTLAGAVTLSCCSNDNISVSFRRPLFFLSAKINISFNHLRSSQGKLRWTNVAPIDGNLLSKSIIITL
jgi:hypothetical protein